MVTINFGPEGSGTGDSILDSGQAYDGQRGYGWLTEDGYVNGISEPLDISANTRDRISENTSNADSLIHLQYPTDLFSSEAIASNKTAGAWQYDLENGTYNVTVGVGDSSYTDSNHVIRAEGEEVISGFTPTAEQTSTENTVTVEVTDGNLQLDALGGVNTKLNFVEVTAADGSGETPEGSDTDTEGETPETETPEGSDTDTEGETPEGSDTDTEGETPETETPEGSDTDTEGETPETETPEGSDTDTEGETPESETPEGSDTDTEGETPEGETPEGSDTDTEGETPETETPENIGDVDGDGGDAGDSDSQLTVGDFSIGFDGTRVSDNASGFFVADNADTGAVLFDVSNPGVANAADGQLTLAEADLLVSPEFADSLGDASLQGADVGDTRIDAQFTPEADNTFGVDSGVTSVFLDLPLLEEAAGFELAGADSDAQPFSDDFQVGLEITPETDFTFSTEQGFAAVDGAIEHDGTVTFDTDGGDTAEPGENPDADNGDADNEGFEAVTINFGPVTANSDPDSVRDIGQAYSDARGSGWVTEDTVGSDNPTPLNVTANTRDRNSIQENNLDSLIHLQYSDSLENPNAVNTPAAWEYALANGQYNVTVSVGDPDFTDSNHVINLEGNNVISGFTPTESEQFRTTTAVVDVTDGSLSIDAIGGENTKLNFVEIAAADGSEGGDTPAEVTPIETPTDVGIPIEGGGVVEMVEPIAGGINFNFGSPSANLTSGFTQDIGQAYSDARGYGWVTQDSIGSAVATPVDIVANGRDRNTSFNDGQGNLFQEPTRDSLIHMQYPTGLGNSGTSEITAAAWEHALENGQYEVTVGVGDPEYFDSNHVINIEGQSVIDGFAPTGQEVNGFTPIGAEAFTTGTATVDVNDGRLTLDAIGGENTKINYISIVPVGGV